MRILAAVAFSSIVFLAPALAAAQTSPAPAAPAAPSAGVNLDEVVCKQTAAPTGSRLGAGRECRTVREWNQMAETSRDTLQGQQQRGLTAAQPGR